MYMFNYLSIYLSLSLSISLSLYTYIYIYIYIYKPGRGGPALRQVPVDLLFISIASHISFIRLMRVTIYK